MSGDRPNSGRPDVPDPEPGIKATCRKIVYDSRRHAIKAAKLLRERRGANQTAYLCQDCGYWHLTSMERAVYRAIKKRRDAH